MIVAVVVILLQVQAAPTPTRGAEIFAMTCSVGYCHGSGGTANRGPRLKGRTFEAGYVTGVVRNGIPQTAMPAFAGKLKEDDLKAVVAWVESIATITEKSGASAGVATMPVRRVPAEFARGRELFFDSTRGTRCGTCHQVDGRGTNAGPDLTGVTAVRNVSPKIVRQVVLTNGDTFPGLPAGEDRAAYQMFDMTAPPPVLRTLPRDRVRSMEPASTWSHADAVAGYSDAELAEITRYLVWLGGSK